KNAKTTPKKRLALSLATSAILASLSIDTAAAACRISGDTTICDGAMTGTINTITGTQNLQLGSENSILNLPSGGTIGANGGNILTTANSIIAGGTVTIGATNSKWSGVKIGNGSRFDNLTLTGSIQGTNLTPRDNANSVHIGGGTLVKGTFDIKNLTTGGYGIAIGDRGVLNSGFVTDFSGITTTQWINLLSASITIDKDASAWNNNDSTKGQHINAPTTQDKLTLGIADGSIVINVGDNAESGKTYSYDAVVTGKPKDINTHNDTGDKACKIGANGYTNGCIGINHLVAGNGIRLINSADNKGFYIEADVASSYGANMFRALSLGSLRRTIMTQNVLDTMTTKTFHSDRYYNQEVELRLLQYDMSRLTNRSSKFAKNTRKNQKKLDKTREKIAKLTLEQSKGQNLDKGYNNFEVIDQLDAIFIPYTGRRDFRFFALPYATHSYVDFGLSDSQEYAGGALFGVQRNLRKNGIFGG
ncbi:hypothetical protein, partial [Helicobacter sp. T3_23-1059]